MINTQIDIGFYKTQYQSHNYVSIENWLDGEYSEKLHSHLYNMNPNWWFHSTTNNGMVNVRNFHYNETQIKENEMLARKKLFNNEFSYIFWRTTGHGDSCKCVECIFKNDLISAEYLTFIYQITGLRVDTTKEVFSSWYRPGNFLSIHSDAINGQLGFSYHLSKKWKPEYGGNLHLLTDSDIDRVVIPSFNTLNLFGLDSQKAHFVSEVSVGVPENRYAISGWWK